MYYDPKHTDLFRKSTETVTKNAGIGLPYHTCSKCGKRAAAMKKMAGTGTSRHNPISWICIPCSEA